MARKTAAKKAPKAAEPLPAEEPAATPPAAAPPEPPAAAVNPFPRNIRTVVFPGGYAVRLNQDQDANEMRIQFGSGLPQDMPPAAALDHIRRQLVPEELKTKKERDAGKDVPWFKFRGDDATGEGSWRLWLRNHPYAAREKAEQVFKAVVDLVAQDRGTGPQR